MHIPKISFVVPIHNNSINELDRVIRSIEDKCVEEKEIIVVDNASTEILSENYRNYCKDKDGLLYHYTDSIGVSNARNQGINLSNGEYIFFVDADDEITHLEIPSKFDGLDLIIYDITVIMGKDIKLLKINFPEKIINRDDLLRFISTSYSLNNSFARLFKRSFLLENNVKFDLNLKNGEDLKFMLDVIMKIDFAAHVSQSCYNYYLSPKTSIDRALKDPVSILKSVNAVREYKNFAANKITNICLEERKNIVQANEELYIKELYNLFLNIFWKRNKTFRKVKFDIYNIISEFSCEYSLSTNLRIGLIKYDLWLVNIIVSFLRRAYLNIRYR